MIFSQKGKNMIPLMKENAKIWYLKRKKYNISKENAKSAKIWYVKRKKYDMLKGKNMISQEGIRWHIWFDFSMSPNPIWWYFDGIFSNDFESNQIPVLSHQIFCWQIYLTILWNGYYLQVLYHLYSIYVPFWIEYHFFCQKCF